MLYRQACDMGNAMGCNNLGLMYQNGEGVAKDDAKAVELYQKSCDAGTQAGYLIAILGGTDAGHVAWAPQVLERAKETGLKLDAQGNLVTATM